MSTRKPQRLKIGKFSVSNYTIKERPALARILLRDIIIVRAELDYRTDAIDYIGLCDQFEAISELEPTPYYAIEKDGYGRRKVTKVVGPTVPMSVNVDDVDEDEDDEEPAPRKRPRPTLKARPVDCDCDEDDCGCGKPTAPKTSRASSPTATFEDVDPLVTAVGKSGRQTATVLPIDHMAITREMIGGKK